MAKSKAAAKVAAKAKTKPEAKPTAKAKPAAAGGAAKVHEREATKGEQERIERGRKLAQSYLEQRDGMDPEIAKMVIEGMSADEVNALIEEANTAVMGREVTGTITGASPVQSAQPVQPAKQEQPEPPAETDVEADDEPIDFLIVEALANDEEYAQLVVTAADAAARKNAAEKEYKEAKNKLIPKMKAAGALHVTCLGNKLKVYKGHNMTLNEQKLLEAGVDPTLIKKGWKDTPYDDVRITAVKE